MEAHEEPVLARMSSVRNVEGTFISPVVPSYAILLVYSTRVFDRELQPWHAARFHFCPLIGCREAPSSWRLASDWTRAAERWWADASSHEYS